MKLISWNVNGIRAAIKKGFLDYFNEQDADIFCLQETKLSAGQLELDLKQVKLCLLLEVKLSNHCSLEVK